MRLSGIPFWRDDRFWRIFSQVLFLVLVLVAGWYFSRNMTANLARLGTPIDFGFLSTTSGFAIGETPIRFDPGDSYARAFLVGLANTFKIALAGIVLATVLGLIVGISRLSGNWLVNRIAFGYVEVLRNTPVLLQIFFWYFAVFLNLPTISNRIMLPGPTILSNRGLWLPWIAAGPSFGLFAVGLLVGVLAAWVLFRRRTRIRVESGRQTYAGPVSLSLLLLIGAAAWLIAPGSPATLSVPLMEGTHVTGGTQLSPEFAAVLAGLAVYTSAYIGEIVRSGIQAVSKGQVEAAGALGLRPVQILRLVVFPQAMRVIVPPLTSQYLNLTKNSSLAITVGYPDLFSIATTVANQTGRSIEMITIIMGIYLSLSLITSLIMNRYNRSVRLVER